MAALTGTNGIVTIVNTTDTFAPSNGVAKMLQPQALTWSNSLTAGARLVLVDADGVPVLELTNEAEKQTGALGSDFFAHIRPWKCPIHASVLTSGTVRIYL